ncbi:MAG: phenylalanyl-tRNA synthetase beta chain [Gaiellaceae bacterium]|jgi:phenylalanyl-tRNA synthetase beta chain|nr:phenylalanyl-tRNA synthetase beta chain [Gaiellaceae bacterium]
MRVPAGWLREYVDFDWPLEELARRLVFTSCEVDRVVRRGVPDADGNYDRYVVGRVVDAHKHPNADKLSVCTVDVGDGAERQIVCGAPNVATGQTVAVVLPGAVMPEGFTIEKRKLRGEVSDGMILSERELELGQDHGGIMVLADALEPGSPLADVLPLGEDVLEIETGYNRPDLTSVYGIAREVSVLTGARLAPQPGTSSGAAPGGETPRIDVEDLERCPRYIGRLFRDVTVGESPPWLKARLLAAGMRPISNVVDVTNYVMLALGNPLHAFDYDRLEEGRIVVRRARAGEKLQTLDGQLRALDPEELVIADAVRAVAIAGIMGGAETEVGAATGNVLLEAANFEPLGILRSAERLHMRTEGSTRWEKGVDPELARAAADYATELLVELAGARLAGESEVRGEPSVLPQIAYRPARAGQAVGVELPEERQRATLTGLGFAVADDWTVTTPSWRARDVKREIDVVEEVARFALEEVPRTLPLRRDIFGWLTREQRLRRLVEDVLVGCGLFEAYTYSLQGADPDPEALELPVPLSALQRVLRTTLVPALVDAARHNVDNGTDDVALFEVAHVYLPAQAPLPEERWRVGAVVSGGYLRAKGAVETLFAAIHVEPRFERSEHPFLATQTSASVQAGWIAQLPSELLEGDWGCFELDLAELLALVPERILYEDVITYPPVRQDLAFLVDEAVPAGELAETVREVDPLVQTVEVVEAYRGEGIPAGQKSVLLRVAFQSPERTLSNEDAAQLRDRVVAAASERFSASLRA